MRGELQPINPVIPNERGVPGSQGSPARDRLALRGGTATSSRGVTGTCPSAVVVCASPDRQRCCLAGPNPSGTGAGLERSRDVSLYLSLLMPNCPQGHILEWFLQPRF